MAQMTISIIFAANTLIRAAHFNTIHVTDIRDTYNAHDIATTGVHGLSGGAVFVGTTTTQTLTNKTLTLPAIGGAGAGKGTLQYANSATSRTLTIPDPGADDTFVTLTATQTLTNKTLTAPVLGGTITGTYTLGGTPSLDAAGITSGTLPVVRGGTGVTTSTGTGSTVLSAAPAFTGTVTFAGNVAFDTSTLFVDATNNLVGVGTASPGSGKLHIAAGSAAGIYIRTSGYAYIAKHDSADREVRIDNTTGNVRFQHGTAATVGSNIFMEASNKDVLLADLDPPASGGYIGRHNTTRCWGKINGSGTSLEDFNVSSTSKNSTGLYTITVDRDFASVHYGLSAITYDDSGPNFATAAVPAAGSFRIAAISDSGGNQDNTMSFVAGGRSS